MLRQQPRSAGVDDQRRETGTLKDIAHARLGQLETDRHVSATGPTCSQHADASFEAAGSQNADPAATAVGSTWQPCRDALRESSKLTVREIPAAGRKSQTSGIDQSIPIEVQSEIVTRSARPRRRQRPGLAGCRRGAGHRLHARRHPYLSPADGACGTAITTSVVPGTALTVAAPNVEASTRPPRHSSTTTSVTP